MYAFEKTELCNVRIARHRLRIYEIMSDSIELVPTTALYRHLDLCDSAGTISYSNHNLFEPPIIVPIKPCLSQIFLHAGYLWHSSSTSCCWLFNFEFLITVNTRHLYGSTYSQKQSWDIQKKQFLFGPNGFKEPRLKLLTRTYFGEK